MAGDRWRAELLTKTATCTALIAAAGWISLPFIPVPITLQTMFVLLTAPVMKRLAPVPVILYLLLGSIGLPVFHSGTAGIGVLLGPTGGYLVGFVPAAFIAGWGYHYGTKVLKIFGIVAGEVAIYSCGVLWLVISTGMGLQAGLLVGLAPFVPGDIVKAYGAYLIGERLLKAGYNESRRGGHS